MKIIYTPNPLRSIIELDEHEKKEFWYKIKIEEMEHLLYSAHFSLSEEYGFFDLNRARSELDPKYFMANEIPERKVAPLDERVDEFYKYFMDDLHEGNMHMGDCICQANSCSKCQAESLLKIDTIPGLGKHEAHNIYAAFSKGSTWDDEHTIEEAIESLSEYECKKAPREGAEAHYPRWRGESERAHKWLIKYKDEHF